MSLYKNSFAIRCIERLNRELRRSDKNRTRQSDAREIAFFINLENMRNEPRSCSRSASFRRRVIKPSRVFFSGPLLTYAAIFSCHFALYFTSNFISCRCRQVCRYSETTCVLYKTPSAHVNVNHYFSHIEDFMFRGVIPI